MTRRKSHEAAEIESRIQMALADLSNGRYSSLRKAATTYDIPKTTLTARFNGRQTRIQSHENQQLLSMHEESELVRWITFATKAGYPVQHAILRSMAQEIVQQRVRQINDDCELVSYPPIGNDWTKRFLSRHPELETVQGQSIDAARVTCATPEAINMWYDAYLNTVQQYEIPPENRYNMDESGFSIGKIGATRVIVNTKVRQRAQAQPGRQEWVSVIECICVDGTAIPPLIIFRGENLSSQWVPPNMERDWKISCNSKGWTSNDHGVQWLQRCFEPHTYEKANGG